MRRQHCRSFAVAIALLIIQVGISTLGTIGMCVDRPHTHGGIPAPDCLMHQPQGATAPVASAHSHHHRQDSTNAPTNTARLACSCSADPVTLLTSESAVLSGSISMPSLNLVAGSTPERVLAAPDVHLSPLSPPPRPSIA